MARVRDAVAGCAKWSHSLWGGWVPLAIAIADQVGRRQGAAWPLWAGSCSRTRGRLERAIAPRARVFSLSGFQVARLDATAPKPENLRI